MSTTQLQAKGGEKWGFKLDPLTVMNLNDIPQLLEERMGLKPSYATIVRRAIRVYAESVKGMKNARRLQDEKTELLSVAGRPN